MKFFPHIDVMMAESIINSPDRDTQGPLGVNTFLNLFKSLTTRLKCNSTPTVGEFIFLDCVISPLLLENLFFLHYQNRTTNALIKYCEVFLLGFCCCFVKCNLYFLLG